MKTKDENYNKLTSLLRESVPVPSSPEALRERILRDIEVKKSNSQAFSVADLVFGWASVRWLRRSLVTTAFILTIFFVWQQSDLLIDSAGVRQSAITVHDGHWRYEPIITGHKAELVKNYIETNNRRIAFNSEMINTLKSE